MKNENMERCSAIAKELDTYYNGYGYKCPHCGLDFATKSVSEQIVCPDCKKEFDANDNRLSLYDYLCDVYDIEYRIGQDKEYHSVRLMVAGGGPNIYIDTGDCEVKLYWWGESVSYPIWREVADEIDGIFQERYENT